jgi:PPK2 family polyphosphate:nucleotide phosphotransferase
VGVNCRNNLFMSKIKLSEIDTRAPKELDKKETKEKTEKLLTELDDLQNLLYAEGEHSVLVILQGMDASGKDGVLRNVFRSMNPLGIQAKPWKAPTEEELAHDFLWRIHQHTPAKGMLQVFNRSHYEDILVTRVHGWCDDATAKKRMRAINDFEWLLQEHNNTHILKFYLHISQKEQTERLEERLKDPAKMWKYNEKDFEEAKLWDKYQQMYEDCFANCNNPPWQIIPADQNWYKEYLIATATYQLLTGLSMQFPGVKK